MCLRPIPSISISISKELCNEKNSLNVLQCWVICYCNGIFDKNILTDCLKGGKCHGKNGDSSIIISIGDENYVRNNFEASTLTACMVYLVDIGRT